MTENDKRRPHAGETKDDELVGNPDARLPVDVSAEAKELSKRYQITETKATFLTNLIVAGGNVSQASRLTGWRRENHYECLSYDEGYKQAYQHALYALGNEAFLKLADRAINGDLIIQNGEIVTDENGEPLRKFSDIAQIYVTKAGGKFTDQPANVIRHGSGPEIHIHMPEQRQQPPVIECNEADTE